MTHEPQHPGTPLLVGGTAAYGRMWQLIDGARESIELETYIYAAGRVGDEFLGRLTAAAARGVSVRVLVDAYGSGELPDGYFEPLIAAGGTVRRFNPKRLLRLSFRNHRKLLCCDGTAVVGGLNVADEYDGDGVERGWRDFAVEVGGDVVTALRASFERMWQLAPFGQAEVRAFWLERPRVANAAPDVPQLLLSGPGCPTAELRRQLVADLRRSRRFRGWAAYFLPSRRVGAAIREAARRGDAAIMLGTRSDVPLSRWASERLFTKFLHAHLRIHRYRPQIVHAKTLVADDVVYVGSANLDVRSLMINYELLLRIPSPALAQTLRQRFEDDVTRADVLDARRWRRERRWWQTLRSYIAYLLLARFDPYLAARKLSSLR
jgi:cardiolipin synthase